METGSLYDQSRQVEQDFRRLEDSTTEFAEALVQSLRGQLSVHPYRTILVAAGAGFVLGGGLSASLAVAILGTGVRWGGRIALDRLLGPRAETRPVDGEGAPIDGQ